MTMNVMTTPTIKTRDVDEPSSSLGQVSCGICRRQISKYTCPSCNLSYCSLNCFQSEAHSGCSETFYRKEIEVGIKLQTSKTEGDRNKMLELLKQMEDPDDEEVLHPSDEENEEDDDIAHRFSAIDISHASSDDLLRLLTEKERIKFFAALKDPSSGLAQELLASAEFQKTRQLPWWEAPSSVVSSAIPYGVKPALMAIPANLIDQASRGVSLLYNICAVLLAYAYLTRHLAVSPLSSTINDCQDRQEALRILSQSVPFLTDRKSTLRHTSLSDAMISFWSRLDPGSIDNETMSILLGDVEKFVRPRRVTVIDDTLKGRATESVLTEDHPCATTIMAMSDMFTLFNTHASESLAAPRKSHAGMKLAFYAAHVLSTPYSSLHSLADQVHILSGSIDKEARTVYPVAPASTDPDDVPFRHVR